MKYGTFYQAKEREREKLEYWNIRITTIDVFYVSRKTIQTLFFISTLNSLVSNTHTFRVNNIHFKKIYSFELLFIIIAIYWLYMFPIPGIRFFACMCAQFVPVTIDLNMPIRKKKWIFFSEWCKTFFYEKFKYI